MLNNDRLYHKAKINLSFFENIYYNTQTQMINFDEILKKRATTKTEAARKLGIEQSNIYRVFDKFARNLKEIDDFLRMMGTSLSSEISPIRDDHTNSQLRHTGSEEGVESYYAPYIEALQTIQKQADTIISQQHTIEGLLGMSKKARSA